MSDYSSICFNGDDLLNFIAFVKSVNTKDKQKIASMHVENNCLVCRSIDANRSFIEYYVELFNSNDDIITETFSVSINDLSALVKCACGNKFIIRKVFNQFEFAVIGNGWLPFNVCSNDIDDSFINEPSTNIGAVNSFKLRDAISSVLGYTQEYTYTQDKYITFTDDKMIVTSRTSGVVTHGEFVTMTLHRDDAARLKMLIKDDFSLSVNKISNGNERILFIGPKFKYATLMSDNGPSNFNTCVDTSNYISVECGELYRLVAVAEEYSMSKHVVGIKIKDSKLVVSVKSTLTANHVSVINSNVTGCVSDTAEAIVPTHNILKALKLFQDKRTRSVNIYFTDDMLNNQNSITMFDDSTTAIVNVR